MLHVSSFENHIRVNILKSDWLQKQQLDRDYLVRSALRWWQEGFDLIFLFPKQRWQTLRQFFPELTAKDKQHPLAS